MRVFTHKTGLEIDCKQDMHRFLFICGAFYSVNNRLFSFSTINLVNQLLMHLVKHKKTTNVLRWLRV